MQSADFKNGMSRFGKEKAAAAKAATKAAAKAPPKAQK